VCCTFTELKKMFAYKSRNTNGKVLAIGAPWNDGKNGTGSGHVRVFAWDSTSAKYTQCGTDIFLG
jgi:hypothetical protein